MGKKVFNLIILGPAGSGKGTQSQMLAKEFGLQTIEMGHLVRQVSEKKDAQGKLAKWMDKVGMHFPDDFIFDLFQQAFKKINKQKGLLIDGYPRTAGQAYDLARILENQKRPTYAILFEVSDQSAMKRLLKRSVCSNCGKIFSSRKIKKCSDCGGKIQVRGYDQEKKAIQRRLDWFHQRVKPAIDFYRRKKILIVVNGEGSIEDISRQVIKKLKGKISLCS